MKLSKVYLLCAIILYIDVIFSAESGEQDDLTPLSGEEAKVNLQGEESLDSSTDDDELSSNESEDQIAEDGYSGSGEFDISASGQEDSRQRITKRPLPASSKFWCGCSLCYWYFRGCCVSRGQKAPPGYFNTRFRCCGRGRTCYAKWSMQGQVPPPGSLGGAPGGASGGSPGGAPWPGGVKGIPGQVSSSARCSSTRGGRECESHCRRHHGGICCGSGPGSGYYYGGQQDCCQHGRCYID